MVPVLACPIAMLEFEFEFDEMPIEFAKHVDKRFSLDVTYSCLPRPWGVLLASNNRKVLATLPFRDFSP